MGSCLWDCCWAGMEATAGSGREGKGNSKRDLAGTTEAANVSSGQGMDIRLARGSIILSFLKCRLQEKKKEKSSFMYSGCKKSFPSCLPLSTGADVFTSGGWLLSCWGQGTPRKSYIPAPTMCAHTDTRESKPCVPLAFVGKSGMH